MAQRPYFLGRPTRGGTYDGIYIYIYMRASISGTSLQKHRPYLGSRPPNKRVEQGVTGSVEIGLACVLYPHVARVARVTRVDRDGKEIGRRAQTPFKIYPIFHRRSNLGNLAPNPSPSSIFPIFAEKELGRLSSRAGQSREREFFRSSVLSG